MCTVDAMMSVAASLMSWFPARADLEEGEVRGAFSGTVTVERADGAAVSTPGLAPSPVVQLSPR